MNKIILSLFSFLILLIGALLIVPSFIDWSDYKEEIITQVKEKTGYELGINGSLRAAFLPTPHVNVENLSVDSAGVEGPVAFKGQVDKASVSLALVPLLSGAIVVDDVTLIKPVFDVKEQSQTSKKQTTEAVTENTSDNVVKDGKGALSVSVDSISIYNAKISYKPLDGDASVVEIPELKMNADDLMGPFDFEGQVKYQQFDLSLGGKIGKIEKDAPLSAAINIDGKAYKFSYSGIVDLSKDVPEVQGEMALAAPSLKAVAQSFGVSDMPVKDQSIDFKFMVKGSANAVSLNNGILKFGGLNSAMPLTFDFQPKQKTGALTLQKLAGSGSIVLDINMTDGLKMSGDVNVSDIPAVVVNWLGLADKKIFENPQVPQSISGDIQIAKNDSGMRIFSKNMNLGQYDVKGMSAFYGVGEEPNIDVSIANFEGATIKANGKMNMEKGVNVSVSHPNAAEFIKVFQKDFKSSPTTAQSFAFNGLVTKKDNEINVTGMDAKIGKIDAKGALSVVTGENVPSIKADLTFGTLDTQALTTGKTSVATTTDGGATSNALASSQSSGASPWTRDAIDTSALRSINLDLNAKANRLVHGTWAIDNPVMALSMKNGVLNVEKIEGGLFDGSINMNANVSAKQAGQPVAISAKLKATGVNLSTLVKAAMAQSKERVVGTGDFTIDLSTQGLSSSALVYGLNADGVIKTSALVVKGIDLDKVTEAISDESLTDLGAVIQGAFNSGQTNFEAANHNFTIREGTMPITNFKLVSPTANLIANGEVSFSRWMMDVKNTVDFTNPDDLPSVEMTLKGPLNAPKNNVASDVLKSFIINKYGEKIQKKLDKVLGDKLKDTPAADLINNLLGLPQKQTNPTTADTPAANDNNETTPTTTQPQPKLEEQLLKGLFNALPKQ